MKVEKKAATYGVMAEFADASSLLEAARQARLHGYRELDAYSPFPIHGLQDEVNFPKTYLPLMVLVGGILGCLGGFGMQWFANVVHYPLNIGGKPFNSWPAFIPITFEVTVLMASLTAVFGMIILNGLPEPYHPVFNVERFALASRDRFFLCIESKDPKFDQLATRQFLEGLQPHEVTDVPW